MEITYLGHSSFLFVIGETRIVFDPFITPNPLAASIKLEDLRPDYILVTHGHGDHIADVEQLAKLSGATVVANHEIATYFAEKGIEKTHGMNTGGQMHFEFGSLKMVNALHSSSFPDGSYAGNPVGFVIEAAERTFYYAGDTALTLDMKLIAEEFKIDFALLPIGNNYTMGIADAIRAANFVGTRKVIGMHYDTFLPIQIDKTGAVLSAKRAEIDLVLMEIGETLTT